MRHIADFASSPVNFPAETRVITLPVWSFMLGVALLMAAAHSIHYLLFHTLAELIAIAVSYSIFTLAWASRLHLKNGYLIVLGAAYVTIGTVDVFHTLTFKGMNLLPGATTNQPSQFWLIARFIEAVALMVAPLYVQRTPSFAKTAWAFGLPGLLAGIAVLNGGLPDTHIEGVGLTTFKVVSEYVIIAILLVGMALLWQRRAAFTPQVFRLLMASLVLAIATEASFTQYVGFYDFSNELGHYFRYASEALAYLALVVTGVRRPAELLYRQLLEQEAALEKANARLQVSEDNLNRAQAVAGIGSWYLDIPRNQLSWSPETYRIFGIAPGTPQTVESFAATVHVDDRPAVFAAWDATLQHDAVYDIEHRIVVTGETRWVRERAEITRSEQGAPLAGVGTVQDITGKKLAELALIDARRYAENLIETANAIIVQLDTQGRVVRLNHAAEEITGYTFDELRDRNWFATIAPRERYPQVWQAFEQLIARDGELPKFENPILTKHGAERYIVWRNSQIVERGQVTGTLSFGLDITETKAMQDRLAASEMSLRDAQSLAQIGSWTYDLQHGELYWSDEIFSILELSTPRIAPSGASFLALVHPDDRERVKAAHRHFRTYHRPYEIAFQLLLPDGTVKYIRQHARAVAGNDSAVLRHVGTLQDITLQVLQEMSLKESEDRFRTIADYTFDWEYWRGPNGEMLYISPSCERITGYSAAEFVSHPDLFTEMVHPDDRPLLEQHQQNLTDKPHADLSYRIITKTGETRWIAHGCQAVFAPDGTPRGRRGSNRDITDLKQAEQLAQQLAYYDTLTQLPNRRLLLDRLLHAISQAKRFQRALAVMFLDLDRFKQVNDTLGHAMGDTLLIEVARRLSSCVREGDTVARTGGDEFIIVLPEIAHPEDATTVADKILAAVTKPITLDQHTMHISTSIGIAVYPINGTDDANELMKKADQAMYAAKHAGRNCYQLVGTIPAVAAVTEG